jgi:DNA primase
VLVEGYTDVIALRQAGVPESVCSMGTALTPQQIDVLAKLAPRVLLCQDPDAAGQEAVNKGRLSLIEHNKRRRGTSVDFRVVRLPAGQDPADVVQGSGGEAMRELLDGAVAVEHYLVERALDGDRSSTDARDEALSEAAEAIAPLGPSVLRSELIKLVSDRLNVSASLVESVIADPARRAAAASASRVSSRAPHGSFRAHGSPRDAEGYDRPPIDEGAAPVFDDPGPEAGIRERNGAHQILDRREQTERAFLAYCLALPDEGERRLAEADLDELFAAPMTRRAAEYLRGRVRTPAADLPPGDEPHARLVAELVIRAGQLEATPDKLELEALQLQLLRLDRLIAGARMTGDGVRELAMQRQAVLDQIRHRLM